MKLNELLKRIIETCNYNEVNIDTDLNIEYVCDIVEPLIKKDVDAIMEYLILPLMSQFRDSEDNNEMNYIQETIVLINKYLLNE